MEIAKSFKKTLSLPAVILFGLSFMAPITVFSTYGIAVTTTNGMIPTGYLLTLIIILFSTYSYAKLAKEFPVSGSSYTFVQKTINPHVGFLVGWTVLLDYMFSPMISSLLTSILFNAYFPSIPMFVWIIGFLSIIVIISILGIRVAANFNTFVVGFQIIFIVVFCIFSVVGLLNGKGTGELFSINPFYDKSVSWTPIISIVPLLFFSFLGFDAVTALAEETKNAKTVLPKAIYSVTFIGAILFIITTYFLQLVFPDFSQLTNPDAAAAQIVQYIGRNFLSSLLLTVSFVAGIASASSSCSSASRIMYAMGREGVLPKRIFGYLSARFLTPSINILIIGLVGCSALFLDLVTATHLISFGVLFAFSFVNLSLFIHFYLKQRHRDANGTILYLIIPLLGFLITFLLLLKLDRSALWLGGSWLIVGLGYLMVRTRMFTRNPPEIRIDDLDEYETP